jgi:hypothetical protein
LNLQWAEELKFGCFDTRRDFRIAFIPAQLTILSLNDVQFDSITLSGLGAQLMPRLIELRLEITTFHGRLKDYFHCPKLKRLYLTEVIFFALDEAIEDRTGGTEIPLSSAVSFDSIPELDTLYIDNERIDGELTGALQSCPLLKHLGIRSESIEEFTPSFKAAIADSLAFPSLKSLCIETSRQVEPWLEQPLARYCFSQRPGLTAWDGL